MSTEATGPNIDLLRTFVRFAAEGEVNRTAAALGVSAPVVSRRLQELAAEPYGLVEKRGNAVVLTEKGRAVLPAVARTVRGYDHLVGHLAGREAVAGCVRVAAGTGLTHTPFPLALAAFRGAQPGVGVQVRVCRGRERLTGVTRGEFDVALVGHDQDRILAACAAVPDLRVESLREQALVVAAAAGSADGRRLAGWPAGYPVSAPLLGELDLLGIDPQSNVRHQLARALTEAGGRAPPRPAVQPGGWTAALACARLGVGAAVLPAELVRDAGDGLVVRPFLAGVRIADRVVWTGADEHVSEFVACLRAAFAAGA